MKIRALSVSISAAVIVTLGLLIGMAQADSTKGFLGGSSCESSQSANEGQPQMMALFLLHAPQSSGDDQQRLNNLDCKAPFALYLNADGSVEMWSTGEESAYAPTELVLLTSGDEVLTALASAIRSGHDVLITERVDGYTLTARPDGSLTAGLTGVYGFHFYPNGARNTGYGIYEGAPA